MVLFTWISRLRDSLLLADQNDVEYETIKDYSEEAEMLFRRLTALSLPQCSIKMDPYIFHYLIDRDVVYLALCKKFFSKRLSFAYLEDLALKFHSQFGKKVHTVTRPYCFIEFDTYIQKARKTVMDSYSRSRRQLSALNAVLADMDNNARKNSSMMKKDATHLNWKFALAKAFVAFVFIFVLLGTLKLRNDEI